MGFIKKVQKVVSKVDPLGGAMIKQDMKNVSEISGAADKQRQKEEAERQAYKNAQAEQVALVQTAKAAADNQIMLQERAAAEDAAKEVAAKDTDVADVRLSDSQKNSTTATAKRRVQFGRNYAGGVSI